MPITRPKIFGVIIYATSATPPYPSKSSAISTDINDFLTLMLLLIQESVITAMIKIIVTEAPVNTGTRSSIRGKKHLLILLLSLVLARKME